MTIPVNENRLNRAVQEINKKFKIPRKNRLRCGPVRNIVERMNLMREKNIEYHSALAQAAAQEPGLGTARKALYRKAISLYGRWTYKAMLRQGLRDRFWGQSEGAEPPMKQGADIVLGCKDGQYGFLE